MDQPSPERDSVLQGSGKGEKRGNEEEEEEEGGVDEKLFFKILFQFFLNRAFTLSHLCASHSEFLFSYF